MARLNYHRLGDSMLAGAMPFRADHVEALHGEGVTAVVNLCQEREYWDGERELVLGAYAAHGITEHHLPVIDGSTVPPEILDQAVEIARSNTVYVHCRGGRERSATVAIAVISTLEDLEIDDALKQAKSRRPIFQPLPGRSAACTPGSRNCGVCSEIQAVMPIRKQEWHKPTRNNR